MALCSGISYDISLKLKTVDLRGCGECITIRKPAKRETGERPVRPRHCIGGECSILPLIGQIGKEGYSMIPEPGDLHKAVTAHASRGGGELIVHHL